MKRVLQSIVNILLLDNNSSSNLGVVNGKMEAVLFFYKYAHYSGKTFYSKYAGELLDKIFEEVSVSTPIGFPNGLTGIGWGIDYLVKDNFVEADSDEVLADIDKIIFKYCFNQDSIFYENFFDIISYSTFRINGKDLDCDNDAVVNYRQIVEIIYKAIEQLIYNTLSNNSSSKLLISEFNSIVFFIDKTIEFQTYTERTQKVISELPMLFIKGCQQGAQWVQYYTLHKLLRTLIKSKTNCSFSVSHSFEEILDNVDIRLTENVPKDNELISNAIFLVKQCLQYFSAFKIDDFNKNISLKLVKKFKDNAFWMERLDKWNTDKSFLDNGLAGLGLMLLFLEQNDFLLN